MRQHFKKEGPIKPFSIRPRHRCPFYGFGHIMLGVMADQEGNQCPLIMKRHSPCKMEMSGLSPKWEGNGCQFFEIEPATLLEELTQEITVFAQEFRPPKAKSWEGMPFAEWEKYVMAEDTPRPTTGAAIN